MAKQVTEGGSLAEKVLALPEFKSPQDVRRYTEEISARKGEDDRRVRFWHVAKRVTLTLVLAASLLIYYLLVAMGQIMTLPQIVFPAVPG